MAETAYHSVLTGTEIAVGLVLSAATSRRPIWMIETMRNIEKRRRDVNIISKHGGNDDNGGQWVS